MARLRTLRQRRAHAVSPSGPIDRARVEAQTTRTAADLPIVSVAIVAPEGVARVTERADLATEHRFRHLGTERSYPNGVRWVDPDASPLWQYQMQYLGAVTDLALAGRPDAARALLDSWRDQHGQRWDRVAWHPYPVSLRLVNICHAAAHSNGFEALGEGVDEVVAIHAAYLLRHLERDVRGNHLLENARALFVASRFLVGPIAREAGGVADALLRTEVPEQVLLDGGHFERSPMYHAIVLQRLLELHSLSDAGEPIATLLRDAARRMAGHLAHIVCPDGGIPLLGDSARGFGPPAGALLAAACEEVDAEIDAATSTGLTSLRDTGLHVFRGAEIWAVLDAGPVCPTYLPAHGQADALSLEVWTHGACLVTDPGLHEYTGPERTWGRSSRAHSTLTVDDADSSEVYGSFRVGGREELTAVSADATSVAATLRPWNSTSELRRLVRFTDGSPTGLRIDDEARAAPGSTVRSRLHLHPQVTIEDHADLRSLRVRHSGGRAVIRSAHPLELEDGRCSRELGRIDPTQIVVQRLERDRDGLARGWFEIVAGDAA